MLVCRHSAKARRAYVLALFVIFLVPLLGMIGLIIDLGLMMAAHRKAQNAADAASLAGAVELGKGNISQIVPEATYYVVTQNGATVPGAFPPQRGPRSGPYQGNQNYVEVFASVSVNTQFLHLLGFSATQTIRARSVAGLQTSTFNQGLLVLDPDDSGALTVSGNGDVTVTGGASITVNSTSSTAATANGNADITAANINITGNYSESGNADFNGTINTGVSPTLDPLAYLSPPDTAGLTVRSSKTLSVSNNQSMTLQPGIYQGGISVSGNATVTLNPGIYYMDRGGFTTSGNANVTGSGVMIYNAAQNNNDDISLSGNGNLNITPPTSGPYQGLTIFQARSSSAPLSISGNGGAIQGTIYAAGARVNISGNGGFTGAQIVSGTISVSGNGNTNISFGGNTALTVQVFLTE